MAHRPHRPARFLKSKHLIAALVPALFVVMSITGFVWAHKGVTIVVDGASRRVSTQAHTVGELLHDQSVPVARGDVVAPSSTSALDDGMTIVVRHATPVTIVAAGDSFRLNVVGDTVADALVAAGLDPSDHPTVSPNIEAPLRAGLEIHVPDVFSRVVEVDEPIAYRTLTRPDPTRVKGTRATLTKGAPGMARRVYRVLVTDGIEGTRQLTSERVVLAPVDEVVAVGTARTARASAARARTAVTPPSSGKRMTVTATAYAPGSDGVDWRTATGGRAGYGVVAVDPDVIPLGTRVFVPGYGYGVASDTGGAIDGRRIDLCYETRAEALLWGRRSVSIIVLN